MSVDQSTFDALMQRVRGGSQEAASDLIAKYGDFVVRAVRKQLPHKLRKAFDSTDFAQIAWGTVFRHRSRLYQCATPTEFIDFLQGVAVNKVRMEVRRRLRQQKYNVDRESPLGDADEVTASSLPTPSQVAIERELRGRLLENQPARHQEIVKLRYMGHQSREIAAQLGLNEGTVRRVLRRLFRDVIQ